MTYRVFKINFVSVSFGRQKEVIIFEEVLPKKKFKKLQSTVGNLIISC